ncbi:hypothetical protein HanRHA438_Chr16g0759711 [Helianthus annuus]|nr:hypothetical protein HanRHA438_Chr16g0759711 [Helianthus annuus]
MSAWSTLGQLTLVPEVVPTFPLTSLKSAPKASYCPAPTSFSLTSFNTISGSCTSPDTTLGDLSTLERGDMHVF